MYTHFLFSVCPISHPGRVTQRSPPALSHTAKRGANSAPVRERRLPRPWPQGSPMTCWPCRLFPSMVSKMQCQTASFPLSLSLHITWELPPFPSFYRVTYPLGREGSLFLMSHTAGQTLCLPPFSLGFWVLLGLKLHSYCMIHRALSPTPWDERGHSYLFLGTDAAFLLFLPFEYIRFMLNPLAFAVALLLRTHAII